VRAALLPLLLLAGIPTADAQSRHARTCADALASARQGDVSVDALGWLPVCRDSGAVGLAEAWDRAAARSSAARVALVNRSRDVRDVRLYASVLRTARDRARPTPDRIDALAVLASYLDSATIVAPGVLAGADTTPSLPMLDHAFTTSPWLTPLPAARLTELPLLLLDLVTADPDSAVRSAALTLRRGLAFRSPELTAVPPGFLSIEAGCGSRVVLRSQADVHVWIELAVPTAGFRREHWLVPGGRAHLLSIPAGEVVAFRNGAVVARLTERDAPCAPGQVRFP
jgi:hypothetical protein